MDFQNRWGGPLKSSATFSQGKNCVFSGVRLDSPMGLPDEVWTWYEQIPIRLLTFFSPSKLAPKNVFWFLFWSEKPQAEIKLNSLHLNSKDRVYFQSINSPKSALSPYRRTAQPDDAIFDFFSITG